MSYLNDESKLSSSSCDYLFFPKDEAELSGIIKAMASKGVKITVAGARTGLVGGCVPDGGALVSLELLNQAQRVYYAHEADEWRVAAQCGMSLRELSQMVYTKNFGSLERSGDESVWDELARYKQDPGQYFYPPDPTEMSASLGGTVAYNASGARSYRYGPTRDWVRRLRVMLPNGEILDIPRGKYFASPSGQFVIYDTKGRDVSFRVPNYPIPWTKSAAGLFSAPHMDLVDLFVGSEGILGIITLVEVALLPKEPKLSIVQFTESDEQALDLVERLRNDKRLKLDFLEFYSANALELLRRRQKDNPNLVSLPPIPGKRGAAVFFEVSFDPTDPGPDFGPLREVVESVGQALANSWAAYEPRELARMKEFRHLLPESVSEVIAERKKKHPGLHRLSSDFAVPDQSLRTIWDIYRRGLEKAGIEWVGFGHIGNNHIHMSSMPKDEKELAAGLEIYADFARKAVELGGTVSAEHGIGKIKAKFLKIMFSQEEIAQMQAVKNALDPQGLLGPGNLFTQ